MIFIGMLAETLKIVGPMGRNVVEALTLALWGFAVRLSPIRIEIFVLFEPVVAKTLSFWANHLALNSPLVPPAQVQPFLAHFGDRKPSIHDI